jgi:APA family basic amino acid/polyamine antiporter
MAEDGLFFRSLARVDPKYRTPVACLWAQTAWSLVLTLSGSYSQLYTYAVFAGIVFHAMIATAVFILRRTRPDAPRPYRTWGYPVVPALFILACLLLIGNTLKESPLESLAGLGLVALGLPAYWMFRKRNAQGAPERPGTGSTSTQRQHRVDLNGLAGRQVAREDRDEEQQ